MEVNYSIRAKFNGGGIGSIAYNAVSGIYRHSYLSHLYVPSLVPSQIPPSLISTFPVDSPKKIKGVRRIYPDYIEDNIFDYLVSRQIKKSDIFHGWNHHCLYSMKVAKKQGAVTVVERASTHILDQNELLQQEYKQWGVSRKPINSRVIEKCLAEYELADFITVPSRFVYDSMVKRGISESKLLLISFGFEPKKFSNLNSRIDNADKFIAIFVGEVGLRKGIPYLLKSWSELNLKNAELWLVGGVNSDIKHIINQYRDHNDIKLFGFRNDIPNLLRQSSVFVFPSIEEGSALVTYEAMAAGLPIITTFNSGSVAKNGESGFVLPIRDVGKLKESLNLLYNDPGLRAAVGQKAREHVSGYTWEQYGENLVAAYTKILS